MKKRLLLIFALMLTICTECVFVFADQENNMDIPHEHMFQITTFNSKTGNATVMCETCGESRTLCFTEHLNEMNCEMFDINNDGIVNGKDYACLKQNYSNN